MHLTIAQALTMSQSVVDAASVGESTGRDGDAVVCLLSCKSENEGGLTPLSSHNGAEDPAKCPGSPSKRDKRW